MKIQKFFLIFALSMATAVAGTCFYLHTNNLEANNYSLLALQNIEALSKGENDDDDECQNHEKAIRVSTTEVDETEYTCIVHGHMDYIMGILSVYQDCDFNENGLACCKG